MAKIEVMDEILTNKIAAGEVVERCSSVVKELVENSIDAGSTEVKIELVEAGTKEIKVTDNGVGMDESDAVNCFLRHATSKIRTETDLFNIETLGFRGEALASIASVSKITLNTSTGNIGTEVIISGGRLVSVNKIGTKKGTIISVRNLFYNTPARLKHMKSLYTELASITDYVSKLALSHTDIKFILTNNGSDLLNTDGTGNLLKTIKDIYGIKIAKKMIEVEGNNTDYEVKGYISEPEIHKSNRSAMITLVNGRVVRNTELNRIINDAYHSFKPDTRYPVVVLNIKVDPSLVDVNIHPTKMDIKFSKIDELKTLIYDLIRNKLSKKTLIPHIEVEEVPKKVYEEIKLDLQNYIEEEVNNYESVEEEIIVNDNLVNEDVLIENEEENEKIFTEDIDKKDERFPTMYPVGIVHGTYIVCQNELGMYMIDQHAAKERINYELYKKQLGNPSSEQISLLFPVTIELPVNEFIIIKENFDFLKSLKFDIEEFGVNSVVVKAHPIWLPNGYEQKAINKILELIVTMEKSFSIEKFNESAATMMSCKMAIKANQYITDEEVEQLIKDLRKCDNPFHCPHGRPTTIFYSNYDMEKLFKRSGF